MGNRNYQVTERRGRTYFFNNRLILAGLQVTVRSLMITGSHLEAIPDGKQYGLIAVGVSAAYVGGISARYTACQKPEPWLCGGSHTRRSIEETQLDYMDRVNRLTEPWVRKLTTFSDRFGDWVWLDPLLPGFPVLQTITRCANDVGNNEYVKVFACDAWFSRLLWILPRVWTTSCGQSSSGENHMFRSG